MTKSQTTRTIGEFEIPRGCEVTIKHSLTGDLTIWIKNHSAQSTMVWPTRDHDFTVGNLASNMWKNLLFDGQTLVVSSTDKVIKFDPSEAG